MSDQLKGILAAVVIVACLALLGFMIYVKAEGAAIAAAAVVTTLVAYFTRAPDKKDPPSGVVVFAGIAAIVVAMSACAPAKAPREQARSVVLTLADGVRQADLACASVAQAKNDVKLAESCANAVIEARNALLVAEDSLDLWQAVDNDKPACGVKAASDALVRIVEAVRKAGGKPPVAVDDALKLAPLLTGPCNG